VCWGNNGSGQAEPPAGRFQQASAGGDHTCGIKTEGTVTCWGRNSDGQATPPDGTFLQVSAGYAHTCGVRSEGMVQCWGSRSPMIGVFRNGDWYLGLHHDVFVFPQFSQTIFYGWEGCGVDECNIFFALPRGQSVVGNWTGDGVPKVGAFRNGRWYLGRNGNRRWDGCGVDDFNISFGLPEDQALVSQ